MRHKTAHPYDASGRPDTERVARPRKPSIPDSVVEAMCKAHDQEEAACMGEPSPWDMIDDVFQGNEKQANEWRRERITAMRCAIDVLEASK